jgi:hypothetical protein
MLEQLRRMHALCLKHEDYSSAGLLDRLIESHARDPEHFWEVLTSNEVWGGAGSLADQCLCVARTPRPSELEADRRGVWRCLAEIAEEMQSAGHLNERTLFWASAFRSWLHLPN